MKAAHHLKEREMLGKCLCWDCLRAEGITLPLSMRGKSRIYPSGEVPKGVGYDFAGPTRDAERKRRAEIHKASWGSRRQKVGA